MGTTNSQYSKEFKKNAVELVLEEEQSVRQTAKELGVSENTLHRWKREWNKNGEDAFPGKGTPTTSKDEELKRLKRENRRLRREREILKKAVSYISPDQP